HGAESNKKARCGKQLIAFSAKIVPEIAAGALEKYTVRAFLSLVLPVHRKMREHQAAARPARIAAKIRIDASAVLSRRSVTRSRVLLNASRVNITASRGSSVNREAKL